MLPVSVYASRFYMMVSPGSLQKNVAQSAGQNTDLGVVPPLFSTMVLFANIQCFRLERMEGMRRLVCNQHMGLNVALAN